MGNRKRSVKNKNTTRALRVVGREMGNASQYCTKMLGVQIDPGGMDH